MDANGPNLDPGTVKDIRVDRLISWGIGVLAFMAFSGGAWQFSGLTSEVRALRDDVNSLTTKVAVFESLSLDKRVRDLESIGADRRLGVIEGKIK